MADTSLPISRREKSKSLAHLQNSKNRRKNKEYARKFFSTVSYSRFAFFRFLVRAVSHSRQVFARLRLEVGRRLFSAKIPQSMGEEAALLAAMTVALHVGITEHRLIKDDLVHLLGRGG